MKKEPTKEELVAEVSALRAEYQRMKKATRELGGRTSRLYIALENLSPGTGRKLTLGNLRKVNS